MYCSTSHLDPSMYLPPLCEEAWSMGSFWWFWEVSPNSGKQKAPQTLCCSGPTVWSGIMPLAEGGGEVWVVTGLLHALGAPDLATFLSVRWPWGTRPSCAGPGHLPNRHSLGVRVNRIAGWMVLFLHCLWVDGRGPAGSSEEIGSRSDHSRW